jgi:hypothetical protein
VLEDNGGAEKEAIDKDSLLTALASAKEAANNYDALLALDILNPIADYTYNPEADALLEKVIFALQEFDCKGALINIINLEEILNETR